MTTASDPNLEALRLESLAEVGSYSVGTTHFLSVLGKRIEVKLTSHVVGGLERNDAESEPVFCLYGVRPGDVVATGSDFDEAVENLARTLGHVVGEIAAASTSLGDCKTALQQWLQQTNEPLARDLQAIEARYPKDAIIRVTDWRLNQPLRSVPMTVEPAAENDTPHLELSVSA